MNNIQNLAVVGMDVTALAASAKRTGYKVFSVDYFGDSDLRKSCLISLSVLAQRKGASCGRLNSDYNPEYFLSLMRKLAETQEIDGILLSSGLEDHPQMLSDLHELAPILGNHPVKIKQVRVKKKFFDELDRIGVKHPKTNLVDNREEATEKVRKIGFPVVIKPDKGFGGYGIRKVSNFKRLQAVLNPKLIGERFIIQEFIDGIAASASVISSASKATTLTINDQLLGDTGLGQQEPFGYCGSVVPLETSKTIDTKCRKVAEKVIRHFGLIGSNGVDFVIGKEGIPQVIEVNPRFQGTLECVERVLGINLVKVHIDACSKSHLPMIGEVSGFCVRLILYALKRSNIPMLNKFEGIRDVPIEGVLVEKGEPLCSIVTGGMSRIMALQRAKQRASVIYRSIKNSEW